MESAPPLNWKALYKKWGFTVVDKTGGKLPYETNKSYVLWPPPGDGIGLLVDVLGIAVYRTATVLSGGTEGVYEFEGGIGVFADNRLLLVETKFRAPLDGDQETELWFGTTVTLTERQQAYLLDESRSLFVDVFNIGKVQPDKVTVVPMGIEEVRDIPELREGRAYEECINFRP